MKSMLSAFMLSMLLLSCWAAEARSFHAENAVTTATDEGDDENAAEEIKQDPEDEGNRENAFSQDADTVFVREKKKKHTTSQVDLTSVKVESEGFARDTGIREPKE